MSESGVFGEFDNFEQRRKYARFFFWQKIGEKAIHVIEDLADETFQLYKKSNYAKSNHPTIFYKRDPKKNFEKPFLIKKFQKSLLDWQLKYGFRYSIEDFPKLRFESWFDLQFPLYQKLKDDFEDRLNFLRRQTTNLLSPENQLKILQKKFDSLTDQEHLDIRNKDFDWVLNTACEFLYSWSLSKEFREKLSLVQTRFYFDFENLIEPPKGFPVWCWQFQSSAEYAEMIRNNSQHELKNSQYLKLASQEARNKFLGSIEKKAENYCKKLTKKLRDEEKTVKKLYPNSISKKATSLKKVKRDKHRYNTQFNWLIEVCVLNQTAESRINALNKLAIGDEYNDASETRNFEMAIRNLLLLISLPVDKNFKFEKGNPKLKNQ